MVRNVAYYQITNHLYNIINTDIIMIKVIIPGTAIAVVAVISVSSANPGIIVCYA